MAQYELNLRDYWQIIQNRRFVFLIVFFAVLIFAVINTNRQKPVYRASASVQFLERRTLGGLLSDLVVIPRGDPLITQSRIITSLPVLEKVAVALGLAGRDATPTEITEAAANLRGMVSTSVMSNTSIIVISVTHGDPNLAANIANQTAKAYIVENLKEATKETRGVREFIERNLEDITAKLKSSEEALTRFREVETPSGVAVALENQLAGLETTRQEFLKRYTLVHPDIKNIDEQISLLKEQMKALPQKELEYSRLKREAEIDAQLYLEFKNKLAAARIAEAEKAENVSIVDTATPPAFPIKPNKSLNYLTGLMIGLVLGFAATTIAEQLDTSIGTIEDVESFIKLPALGVIPYLKTKDEKKMSLIRKVWPKEFTGKEKIARLRNQLVVHYASASPIFEAYRILRTNIQTEVFKKEEIKGKILLFSSAGPEEGKSITVSNLAISMAQGNLRTLLIDCDMRRSSVHNIFGLKDRNPGLSNVLRGMSKVENVIRTLTDILMGDLGFDEALKLPGLDNLSILTSGSAQTLPAELLSSPEMANLLKNLREKFDIILLDSPPVMAVADASILASKVDGIVLVYRVGKTARAVLARTKSQITESGGLVKGIILNNISPEIELRYGYYYHYKYYGKYYTDKKTEK